MDFELLMGIILLILTMAFAVVNLMRLVTVYKQEKEYNLDQVELFRQKYCGLYDQEDEA